MSVHVLLIMIHFSFILRVGDNRKSGLPNVCDSPLLWRNLSNFITAAADKAVLWAPPAAEEEEFFISRCSCTTALSRGNTERNCVLRGVTWGEVLQEFATAKEGIPV